MMTNEQMKPGRFAKWAKMRRMFSFIVDNLNAGNRIQVTTYTRSTVYTKKHVGLFTCGKTGVYVVSGKSKVDVSLAGIRALIN